MRTLRLGTVPGYRASSVRSERTSGGQAREIVVSLRAGALELEIPLTVSAAHQLRDRLEAELEDGAIVELIS